MMRLADLASSSFTPIVEMAEWEKHPLSMEERHPTIPFHTAVRAGGTSINITVDFASERCISNTFFLSEEYKDFRRSLLETIQAARGISTRTILTVAFPHWSSQSVSVKECQKELIKRIAQIVNQMEGLEKVDIVLKRPETSWTQVQSLAPFYSLRFKGWTACIKEGDKIKNLFNGSEWDRRLKGLFRQLKERKEL